MVNSTLGQQLIEQFRHMTAEQQQQLLDYAQTLTRPRGIWEISDTGRRWLEGQMR